MLFTYSCPKYLIVYTVKMLSHHCGPVSITSVFGVFLEETITLVGGDVKVILKT